MDVELMSVEEKLKVLDDFVLNRAQLLELSPYLNELNLFDVLKIKDREIRHSNILAWLLDPYGTHGIGDQFIRLFVERVIRNNPEHGFDATEWAFLDYSKAEIAREKHWKDIKKKDSLDILVKIDAGSHDYIIAIENKVNAKESPGQTEKYRKHIEEENPNAQKMYVFLTVNEDEPEDPKWAELSYRDIYDLLGIVVKYNALNPEAEIVLNNYRKVTAEMSEITDAILIEKVKKIYRQNKAAIDLINKYKPDIQFEISEYIKNKIKEAAIEEYDQAIAAGKDSGNIVYEVNDVDNGILFTRSYVRFNTRTMNAFIPPLTDASSCWNTNSNYYYQITYDRKDEKITCALRLALNNRGVDPNSTTYKNGSSIIEKTKYKGKNVEKKHFRFAFDPLKSPAIDEQSEDFEWKPIVDQYVKDVLKKVTEIESLIS